ncbi:MAG: Hsp20/alpha crystallin family protein [Legionella sp.]|jgi:HSP20 family protein|nr:Hsp20/alpha crystallin family protein [Legionella sp.]
MNLITRRPVSFSRELDAFFDNFLENSGHDQAPLDTCAWRPLVDLKEEDTRYVVYADIPGVKPEDIHVSIENNLLSISGERVHESKESKEGFARIEREHGRFNRQFKLPDSASSSEISAHFNHGVLEVIIPKKVSAKPQRIEVNVNSK